MRLNTSNEFAKSVQAATSGDTNRLLAGGRLEQVLCLIALAAATR